MSTIVLGTLDAGSQLRVDVATLIDTRALITGNSGAGKSRLMRRMAEQAFGKVQVVVVDPEGEFATLRERHGFLLAGRTGEVQAEPRAAALLARRLMELRISAVLDLYDLRLQQRREFVRLFLEALVDLPKDLYAPVLVLLDEAHLFCPEKAEAESAGAVIDLMTRGRKRGVCGVLATQRLSKLDKDAAAEAKNVFVGGITLDVDQKRAADTLGLAGREERLALRDIPPGRFLAFGPALSAHGVSTFTAGETLTTHPKAGQRHTLQPTAPPEAIQKVAAELKDLPQQAAEEIRTLQAAQARIRELERQLRARPKEQVTKTETRIEWRHALKDTQVATLGKTLDRMMRLLEQPTQRIVDAARAIEVELARATTPLVGEVRPNKIPGHTILAATAAPAPAGTGTLTAGSGSAPRGPTSAPMAARRLSRSEPTLRASRPTGASSSSVQQRILDALAELEVLGVSAAAREQVAFLAGYTNLNSKSFSNAIGALRSAGLITYPGPGRLSLSGDGRARAAPPEQLRSSEDLQERVMGLLGGTTARILCPLLEAYPGALERADLMQRAGYGNANSKSFVNAVGRLRSLGFIDYPAPGHVAAQPVLFLEGRA